MLSSARSLGPNGHVNLRQYRLEMGYLARYVRGGDRRIRRTLRRLRGGSDRDHVRAYSIGDEALLSAIPIGLAFHDRPRHAATIARDIISVTHGHSEAAECGALLASAVAHAIRRSPDVAFAIVDRRAWIQQVIECAGGDDNTSSLKLLTVADLASCGPEDASSHIGHKRKAIDSLEVGLYVALRHMSSPTTALETLSSLSSASGVAGGIALGLIGVRVGQTGMPTDQLALLQDAQQLEAWGEKLALVNPTLGEPTKIHTPSY